MHFCACFLFCSRFVWWYVYCSLFTTLTAFENAIHVALEIQVRIVVFVFDFFSLSTLGNYKRKKSWKIDSKKVNDENVKHTHTFTRGVGPRKRMTTDLHTYCERKLCEKLCMDISLWHISSENMYVSPECIYHTLRRMHANTTSISFTSIRWQVLGARVHKQKTGCIRGDFRSRRIPPVSCVE